MDEITGSYQIVEQGVIVTKAEDNVSVKSFTVKATVSRKIMAWIERDCNWY